MDRKKVKTMAYFNMTVPHDRFSIDNQPTIVKPRTFDGKDLEEICFTNLATNRVSHERSASIETFGFNGTAIVTPSAFDQSITLDVHDIERNLLEDVYSSQDVKLVVPVCIDSNQLCGSLLVLELKTGVAYGPDELRKMLDKKNRLYKDGKAMSTGYIVLFKTGLMDRILEITDENGIPDENKLKEIQKNRPGITHEGARYLSDLGIAKVYAIDNISFETETGSRNGFLATQSLMNRANNFLTSQKPTPSFTPLVYHVARTTHPVFEDMLQCSYPHEATIELGNIPGYRPLPGYPVSFRVKIPFDFALRCLKKQ